MNPKCDPFDKIAHATPCDVPWSAMSGDERVRLCGECAIHVYNFENMTREEVTELVTRTEGRVCARFYRRTDGTIVTSDCPVAFDKLKHRIGLATSAFFSIAGLALGALLWVSRGGGTLEVKKIGGVEKLCNWGSHNNPY